jgi:hypothetical protein
VTGSEWRQFQKEGVSFEYPNGWHVSGNFNYESVLPDRPDLDPSVILSPDPIVRVYPGDSWSHTISVGIHLSGTDLSYYDEYEEGANSFEESPITVGGMQGTAKHFEYLDRPFGSPYIDVIVVDDGTHKFELRHDYAEADDRDISAWTHLLETFSIK